MQIDDNTNKQNNLQPNSYISGVPGSRSVQFNKAPADSDSWSDHTRLLAVQAAAIRFLVAWRASLAGNPKAWLAEATRTERALEDVLVASGVNPAYLKGATKR